MFPFPITQFASGRRKRVVAIAGSNVVVQTLSAWLQANTDWNGVTPEDVTINITGKVWSNTTSVAALVVDTGFPAATKITINVAAGGLICGKGGGAGCALKAERAVTVDNQGSINGGGYNQGGSGHSCPGGGDGSPGVANCNSDGDAINCGSCTAGTGGTGYGYGYSSAGSSATSGATGSPCGGGGCCCCSPCTCPQCSGGAGGTGGGPGTSGAAVQGNSNITWTNAGTRNGSVS